MWYIFSKNSYNNDANILFDIITSSCDGSKPFASNSSDQTGLSCLSEKFDKSTLSLMAIY